MLVRLIVATHPASSVKAPIGTTRDEMVYELFYTTLPPGAFTPSDVLALYFHRGGFEAVLSDEDAEQDPDRWCSRTAYGQEFWQVICQWSWNLRLELGHRLHPLPMRRTEFAPAQPQPLPLPVSEDPVPVTYGPPQWAQAAQMGGFAADSFLLQPDATLLCPDGKPLYPQERRPERNGSVRLVYAARIGYCRVCLLRQQCLGYGAETKRPRRVSAVLWPLLGPPLPPDLPPAFSPPLHPLIWGDWSRRQTRRTWMTLLRTQTVTMVAIPGVPLAATAERSMLTRQQRAHYRMSWDLRRARNTLSPSAPSITFHLFGIPAAFAASLGLQTQDIG